VSGDRQRLRRLAPVLLVALVIVLILAGFYCYGLGSGGKFYFKLVKEPFAPAVAAPYYRASILHVMLAHWLGLGASILAFRLAVLGCFWAALGYLAMVLGRRLSSIDTCLVLLVLMFHPSAMIVYSWTCHPDALTYLLTALLMFSRRPWVLVVVAALGAWNHLAMWTIVCIEVGLLWAAFAGAEARRRTVAMAAGLVLGAVTCKLVLWSCGVEIGRDRLTMATGQDPGVLLGYWTQAGWPVLYTLYFAHLLWLPALVARLYREHRRGMIVLIATQAIALMAAFFAQDTTRVFVFLSWGPLVYCLVHVLAGRVNAGVWLRALICAAVVGSIVGPKIYAWKGDIRDTEGARAHLKGVLGAAEPR